MIVEHKAFLHLTSVFKDAANYQVHPRVFPCNPACRSGLVPTPQERAAPLLFSPAQLAARVPRAPSNRSVNDSAPLWCKSLNRAGFAYALKQIADEYILDLYGLLPEPGACYVYA